jgi:transcription antitermination factor NusG
MVNGETAQWYAIRTRSRCEKVVRDQLTGRGIEPLLPLRRHMSQWKDRRKLLELPLFSGYCFGRFVSDQRMSVLQTPGVIQIIGSATWAEPIPDEEMRALQRLMQFGEICETYPYDFLEGAMITVLRGPLQGLQGRFVRRMNRCRLIIAVNLIQQAAAVDIAAEDVAPAEEWIKNAFPAVGS